MTGPEIYLAFDYGTVNIGVAVGQKVTKSATVLSALKSKNRVIPWEQIDKLISNWYPSALVVGVPHTVDGKDLKITVLARQFISQLQLRYSLPVYEVEEMLTTKSARAEIFNKGGYKALQNESVDSFAAKIILEAWMNG